MPKTESYGDNISAPATPHERDESPQKKTTTTTCIRSAMLYGSEIWATKIEDIRKMQRSEMRMLRWMT